MSTIKNSRYGEFTHLLAILRLAVLDNRQYVAFPKKKFNYLFILKNLQMCGFIDNWEERGEILVINLKQTYWKTLQHPLQAFSNIEKVRLNRRMTATAKQFIKIQKLHGQAVYYSISTDAGIISGWDASSKKIGGLPLFKIY